MSITPVVPLRPWLEHSYNTQTVCIEGKEYEFKWDWTYKLHGPSEVGRQPEVHNTDVYSYEKRRYLTWEEFRDETLWFYDEARVSALIFDALEESERDYGW